MELPLINKIKNDLGFIDKNFTNINRYKSFFNKLNLAQSSNSTIDSKINLLNSNNSSDNKKSDQFNSKSRNTFNKKLLNDILKNNNSIYNNNNHQSNIFNNNINNYFSLSNSRNNSRFNLTSLSKNINNFYNHIIHDYSDSNDFPTEKRMLKSNKSSPNIIIPKKKEIKKIDKILTKFKLNRIISNHSNYNCYIQEIKDNLFFKKYKKKLLSDKFINNQINIHKHFLFGKNESSIKNINNYLINMEYSNSLKKNLSSEDIISSLNKKEIKLIKSDPSYFKDVNENIIKDLIKIKSKRINLIDILNKEEQKHEPKEPNKKKIKQEIRKKGRKILYNYDEHIKKIINDDLTKRLKKIKIKAEKNDIEKVLNDFPSKISINIGKIRSEKNIKCEDRCFQTFMSHFHKENRKEYLIERNRERLKEEKSFQFRKDLKNKEEGKEKDIIFECLNNIKKGIKDKN